MLPIVDRVFVTDSLTLIDILEDRGLGILKFKDGRFKPSNPSKPKPPKIKDKFKNDIR